MKSRWMELLGMVLIGDGILNVVQPSRHSALWNCGPEFSKKSSRALQSHPGAARGMGIAFVALGIWLSRRAAKA